MKQQFETAPGVACYVQASTVKCRKFFTNLGFEVRLLALLLETEADQLPQLLDRRNVGSGIVNDRGEEQPLGSGFEVFSMIHVRLFFYLFFLLLAVPVLMAAFQWNSPQPPHA